MPGRQAHGRPLMGGGPVSGKRKQARPNKARANKKALDAFSIANREVGDRQKLTPRNRELNADLGGRKRGRSGEDDEDEDSEDEEDAPPRKMRRGGGDRDQDDEVEFGSDSSGNEWQVGAGDDDSDIESDDAFGESDEERFQGYAFSGSKKKADDDDEDDDEDQVDGASLGSDAVDLADILDMPTSDDDEDGGEEEDDDSDDDSESERSESESESEEESVDSEDDVSETDVKDWVNKFSAVEEKVEEAPKKTKLDLKDLGLLGISDPALKKSLKMMSKEEKSSKPQKLEVPLARRQQGRLDRQAAYDETNKTLDRWTETVKQNRRADHLMFPLAQNETGLARHDNTEIAPMNRKAPGNELESTIFGIMEESGLGPKTNGEGPEELDENGELVSRKDLKNLWQAKRREREAKSREEARAKRIKKIKSKAYHRVHRKERERNEVKEHEALVAAGEVDSEDERDARDRQRATERMGARHRESKWAKLAKKGGLAVWDDSVREGMTEMARRDEELRKRVESRGQDSDDDSDYSGDSGQDDRNRLLRELEDLDAEDEPSGSKLMNMAFMKKAEAAKRKENDEMVAQIRRELAPDDEDLDDSEADAANEVGRRSYGLPGAMKNSEPTKAKKARTKSDQSNGTTGTSGNGETAQVAPTTLRLRDQVASETGGAWSMAAPSKPSRKQKGKKSDINANVLDLDASIALIKAPESAPQSQSKRSKKQHTATTMDESSDEDGHIIQFRQDDLLDKAFSGLDVVAEFEAEKRAAESEDDEKVIDNTLPGWGSWVGDGVSAREKKRNQGRFLTKKEGIQKDKRKDAKMKNVVMNEKIIKKNAKFLASQLPHPYESQMQYERALRLPVGPEWVTKQTHQEATKPRVIVKQGIIAPMAKPMQ